MPIEAFLVPQEGTGTRLDPWRPKYVRDPAVARWGQLRYTRAQDETILVIEATQPYLDNIAAQSDATRLATADNIDQPVTLAQANAARAVFEAAFIPGQFINEGDTRRQILRGVAGMFLFSQRMTGRFGVGWKARAQGLGITLDSQWNTFPQALQDEFQDIADSFGWNVPSLGLSGTSTLREIMQVVSQQFENTPIEVGGFVL